MIIALVVFHFQRNLIANSSNTKPIYLYYGLMYLKIFVFSEKIGFGTCQFIDEGLEVPMSVLTFCGLYSEPSPYIYQNYILKFQL